MAGEYHSHGTDSDHFGRMWPSTSDRIVQEALHNVQKHAGATHVIVRFAMHEADAVIVIEDDGQGFAAGARSATASGLGLVSMRERARVDRREITIRLRSGEARQSS